jgi:hypothetical protein
MIPIIIAFLSCPIEMPVNTHYEAIEPIYRQEVVITLPSIEKINIVPTIEIERNV